MNDEGRAGLIDDVTGHNRIVRLVTG